jgi:hypothetical protein
MPTINELASTNTITGSDQFPVYVSGSGDARKASASTLLAYIQSAWMDPTYTRVTASPTLAGFTLPLPTTANSLFVLLTPTGTMATGTIVLPAAASAADGQEIVLYTSQEVTALSFTLNGATALNGAPTGIQAGAALTLRYDALSVAWYTTTKPSSVGSGTPNYLPKWTAPTTLGDSIVRDNGTAVSIGGVPTGDRLTVYGTAQATAADSSNGFNAINSSSTAARFPGFRAYNYAGAFAATCETVFQASTARGTFAAPAALLSGDRIGALSFWGHNGVDFFAAANVYARATSNWAAARASELYFQTTSAGTTADRLRISPTGNVQLATNNAVFDAGGTGQGVRLSATPGNPDPNVLDAYDEGTWIPVPNLSVPVTGTVNFTGRYVRVGNLVTLELKIKTQAASTFTWTNVTDWFTGLPASVMPTIEDISTGGAGFVSYMGVIPGAVPSCGILLDAGVFKFRLFSAPAASFTLPADSSMRATLVYFVP